MRTIYMFMLYKFSSRIQKFCWVLLWCYLNERSKMRASRAVHHSVCMRFLWFDWQQPEYCSLLFALWAYRVEDFHLTSRRKTLAYFCATYSFSVCWNLFSACLYVLSNGIQLNSLYSDTRSMGYKILKNIYDVYLEIRYLRERNALIIHMQNL